MNNYIHIGKFVATHGLQGELILKHALGKKSDFKTTKVFFIEEVKTSYIPYFKENAVAKSESESIIKLEGINAKEAAAKLLQKKIWLSTEDFEKNVSKTAPVNLIGFLVMEKGKSLGTIEAVIEQPMQIILQTKINNKEVLIPLHESTLQKIDRKKKEVHLILPEGLLEVYL